MSCDLSIVIPSFDEEKNLAILLPLVKKFADKCACDYEIIVVEGDADSKTKKICDDYGAKFLPQQEKGFGKAIWEGIESAVGKWVLTMDADCSHDPRYIPYIWEHRKQAELIIGSRYARGGYSDQSWFRATLSQLLNMFAKWILDLPIYDVSGGFKLYRKSIFKDFQLSYRDFNVQIEAVVKTYAFGHKIFEVPFHFKERSEEHSRAHIISYGITFFSAIFSLWRMRNTVYFADYDERAFRSRFWPQKVWHKKRFELTMAMKRDYAYTLEVGCGSGRMLFAHPDHIAVDVDFKKIRYLNKFDFKALVADGTHLPFPDRHFEQILCQEVLEHVENPVSIINEMNRVLKIGGNIILSTPDYGKGSAWPLIERVYEKIMPGAYAEEHIYRFDQESLKSMLEKHGFEVKKIKSAFASILHVNAVKTSDP